MKPMHGTDMFQVVNMGSIKSLPRWLKSNKAKAYRKIRKDRIEVYTPASNGLWRSVGKITFKNSSMTGRTLKVINTHCEIIA